MTVRQTISAMLLAFVASVGCTSNDSIDKSASAVGTDPSGYVATPAGYVHSSCVIVLQEGEAMQDDGSIRATDGSRRDVAPCAHPRLGKNGQPKSLGANEAAPYGVQTNWVMDASDAFEGALRHLAATWKVPSAPAISGPSNLTLFYFPGLEVSPGATNETILQPVLAWTGGGQWSIASWAVGPGSNEIVSPSINVSPGDTLVGDVTGTNCNATTGICTAWTITTTDSTTGKSAVIHTGSYGVPFAWSFGGVLEAYNVGECGEMPKTGQVNFTNIQATSVSGANVTENWSNSLSPFITTETPQCGFSVTDTSNSVTLTSTPTTATIPQAPTTCGTLTAGQGLLAGQSLSSCDGTITLSLQYDGSLVLTQGANVLWSANTSNSNGFALTQKADGNLVLEDETGNVVWSSGTGANAGAITTVDSAGSVSVRLGTTVLWSTSPAFVTARVLGFESTGDWTASGGALLGSSSYASQGKSSLTVTNVSYTQIASRAMSAAPAVVGSNLALDIAIPPYEPNPYYYGQVEAFINIPSRGVYNTFLGPTPLYGLIPGTFNTVVLPVPANVITALNSPGFTDFTITLVLDVPANPGTYTIDNLRFLANCIVPATGLAITSSAHLCNGIYALHTNSNPSAITVAASGVTLTCDGTTLVNAGGTASGFSVNGQNNVTITGCTATGFQYGAIAQNASGITINQDHFDSNFDQLAGGNQTLSSMIQGGGINFTNVKNSVIENSTASYNWNGVELVGSTQINVLNVTASHCFNTGLVMVTTTNSQILGNKFDWGVSYASYPDNWYGAGTNDAAGLIMESSSNGNLISGNSVKFGGDGIFIRATIGTCSTNNRISSNDTSYAANNAIESWCYGNIFDSNTASYANYGLWTGGSDSSQLTNNIANNNMIDGISIQNSQNRHVVIANNTVNNNGRYGLLISGHYCTNEPDWSCADEGVPTPVDNESQILVQQNTMSNNAMGDMEFAYVRGVELASNCAGTPLTAGGSILYATTGTCGDANGRSSPTAAVASITPVAVGSTVTLDASGSKPEAPNDTLTATWLVQPAAAHFIQPIEPSPLLDGVGLIKQPLKFTHPGMFDIDLTITDTKLAGQAYTQLAVIPTGTKVGQTANLWTCAGCPGAPFDDPNGVDGTAVHFTSDANALVTLTLSNLNFNASKATYLGFFVRATDPNNGGIGSVYTPDVTLTTNGVGTIQYNPVGAFADSHDWTYVEIPLASPADGGWFEPVNTGSLSQVNEIQISLNGVGWSTWQPTYVPVDFWIDSVTFY